MVRRSRAAGSIGAVLLLAVAQALLAGPASAQGRAGPPAAAPSADQPTCRTSTGEHHAYTLLGFTFYRFRHRVDWCTQGGQVVRVSFRNQTFTDASSFAQYRGLTEDYVTPVPAAQVESTKKATVENCLPPPVSGCYSVRYPYVTIMLRGDGTSYAVDGE